MRRIAAALVLLLALSPTAAAADPEDELSKVTQQLDGLQDVLADARSAKTVALKNLAGAKERWETAAAALEKAENAVAAGEQKLAVAAKRLEDLGQRRARIREELAGTRLELDSKKRRFESVAVDLYVASTDAGMAFNMGSLIEVMVVQEYSGDVLDDTTDLLDGLAVLERVENLHEQDLDAATRAQESAVTDLSVQQLKLEAERAARAEASEEADRTFQKVKSILAGINADIAAAEQHKEGLAKAAKALEEEIARRASKSGKRPGILAWPVPGPVTSPFGWRIHPILGTRKLHTGIDLEASYGDSIKAAGAGKVILAGVWGGYGNAVVIDHGGGLTSVYAHISRLTASAGKTVKKGQRIGYVGCSGLCTGPHLHFETRENGVPVNPMKYLT